MKALKGIKKVWDAIFDFFCGDYRAFFGVAVTIGATVCLTQIGALSALRPAGGVVLVVGVVLSFGWAIFHAAKK